MVEFGVVDAITSGGLAPVHARSADLVGHVKEMELAGGSSFLEQAHPSIVLSDRVGVEVQDNASLQQPDDMVHKGGAKPLAWAK